MGIGKEKVQASAGRVQLSCGDVVTLGELKVTFYTPPGLYDYLTNAPDPVS